MGDREWILLNPGPANTTATVRAALVMPDLCHREPEYFDMMRRCRAEVTRLAGCGTDWTTVLFTGSAAAHHVEVLRLAMAEVRHHQRRAHGGRGVGGAGVQENPLTIAHSAPHEIIVVSVRPLAGYTNPPGVPSARAEPPRRHRRRVEPPCLAGDRLGHRAADAARARDAVGAAARRHEESSDAGQRPDDAVTVWRGRP